MLARTGESPQEGQAVAAMARKAAAQVSAIRDHWVTPDGDERALAVVEVDEFKKALQGVDGDDRMRREMFANVDRAVEQIARAREGFRSNPRHAHDFFLCLPVRAREGTEKESGTP